MEKDRVEKSVCKVLLKLGYVLLADVESDAFLLLADQRLQHRLQHVQLGQAVSEYYRYR